MDKKKLAEILNDDDLNILDIKNKAPLSTPDDRLKNSFKEISKFFKQHQREPTANIQDMIEYKLYERLKNIRSDPKKVELLLSMDKYNLLVGNSKNELEKIEDIFEDDDLNLLAGDESDIFDLKNVPKRSIMPDEIAARKPCKNFDKFKDLFQDCKIDIKNKSKLVVPFTNEQQIQKGHFFILNGIMVYIANVGEKLSKKGKTNARLKCIFENGTESNMLLRSLATSLYLDNTGRRIVQKDELVKSQDVKKGLETGYIYILRSLSQSGEISSRSNLYKVGYCKGKVESRIKNASKDPTYLMAPVEIVSEIRCFNLNPQKFERTLHHFFSEVCLDIEIKDVHGKNYRPKEWFEVPLDEILLAVKLILNGEIIHYKYNPSTRKIESD